MPERASPATTYELIFLETGKDASSYSPDEIASMQELHVANLRQLAADGHNRLAGPVQNARPLRGIIVMAIDGPRQLSAAFASDPYIAEGLMVMRSNSWHMTVGALGKPYEPSSLGQYAIGLVGPGENGGHAGVGQGFAHAAAVTRLARHLAKLDGESGRHLAVGGPLDCKDPCGMLLFRSADLKTLEEIVASAPDVRSGELRVELRPFVTYRGALDEKAPALVTGDR